MAALKGVSDLGEYLREQRQHAKLSLRQLAEVAGVSNPYLSQVERGLRKPSAEVLTQIAKGLRISAEALYVRAGLLDERGHRVEVEAAVLADPHLSERQRRVLLDIYETFRTENARESDVPIETAVGAALAESSAAPTATKRSGGTRKTAAGATTPARKGNRESAGTKARPAPEGGN